MSNRLVMATGQNLRTVQLGFFYIESSNNQLTVNLSELH